MQAYRKIPGFDTLDPQWNMMVSGDRHCVPVGEEMSWPCGQDILEGKPPGLEIDPGFPPETHIGAEFYGVTVCYAGPQWLLRRYKVVAQTAGNGPVGRVANGQRLY